MLLQKSAKQGDTVSIKLSSGEEMVARLESDSDNHIVVHKPLMLVAQGAGMGLAPYMFTTKDEKYTLNRDNIICIASTEKEMADKYVESTTGLKLN
jgi:hypothetical protein